LDALTRILEVETFDAIILFVRTKTATLELAERLQARGHAAAALNGDIAQKQREQRVEQLKKGKLDILVATDVAARGLDVDRVSHVINYDIPYDTESYIHRIGRTGRAGRTGDAILFVAPRERRMLSAIERATRQKIPRLTLPSTEMVNQKRVADFKQRITDTLEAGDLDFMQNLLEEYQAAHPDVESLKIASALGKIALGEQPLLLTIEERRPSRSNDNRNDSRGRDRPPRGSRRQTDTNMQHYRLEVGREHGVKPGNIVGAIANEAGIDAKHIGHIAIQQSHSLVDLPADMPDEVFRALQKVWVCGQQLQLSLTDRNPKPSRPRWKKQMSRKSYKD
jgi:ATP-dependent RNA helicase DeaD